MRFFLRNPLPTLLAQARVISGDSKVGGGPLDGVGNHP